MGTTTCAVALAASDERAFVLDLALATGDAAEVAAAHVAVPDALLRIACGPVVAPAELAAGLAHGEACRVLPAPALPEHADLIDEQRHRARARSRRASGLRAIADCGSRLGVETIPALERARIVAIVASADARGARGARAVAADREARSPGAPCRPRRHGLAQARAAQSLAAQAGLPLLAAVKPDARVARARERGLPPPGGAFAALAALAVRR